MRISDWSSDVCSSDLGRGSRIRNRDRHSCESLPVRRHRPQRCSRRSEVSMLDLAGSNGSSHEFHVPIRKPLCGITGSDADTRRMARRSARKWRLESGVRSEEHTSELQSLMRISYAVFCLKKKI